MWVQVLSRENSQDLNYSNRPVRTRMPGGVAGVQRFAAPYADQYAAFVIGPDGHNIEAVCHQPEA